MLTTDDLARAAETVIGRVSPEADAPDVPCRSNHLAIARAGVEEGLKLALRLLRDLSRALPTSDIALAGDGEQRNLVTGPVAACESPARR